jgi:hypothetical protein
MKACVAAFLLFVQLPGLHAAERFVCDPPSRETVRLLSVGERLDIFLADGRMVYFPTLEPPRASRGAPNRPRAVAEELGSLLAGKDLSLQKLGPPDRWGRIPSRLYVPGEDEPADEILAAAGLAMAGIEGGACAAKVRVAEAAARAEKLGLWADPEFAVIAADERQDLTPRAGTLALVEGRVSSLGRTPPRLYINFGAGRGGLALTISRRNQPLFERAGLTEKNLAGKSVRARGVVEIGSSPQIELFHPEQIESIESGS